MNRVAVTGMAWRTALGSGLEEVWKELLAGASGIRPVPSDHAVRNELAAVVPDLPLKLEPSQRQHLLSTETVLAALRDAGVVAVDPRLHAVLGTSYGPHLDTVGVDALDGWTRRVAGDLGLVRQPVPVTTACSSGSDSLLVGAESVRSGAAEVCVCGAADILTPAKRLGHSALGTMSPTALRSFDVAHDGTLLGEGAAFLVLESEASAVARGARIHGYLIGEGSSNDAASSAAPDPSGDSVVRAVERALAAAGRSPGDVTVINAHGSGTPVNDEVEHLSYTRLFGESDAVVFATKGAFGHSLGATGAIEAVALLLALGNEVVPPVRGLADPVAGFPLRLPVGQPAEVAAGVGLSVTLGFGGFNTCLAFEVAR